MRTLLQAGPDCGLCIFHGCGRPCHQGGCGPDRTGRGNTGYLRVPGDSTSEAISVGADRTGNRIFPVWLIHVLLLLRGSYGAGLYILRRNGSVKGGKVFTIPGTFCLGDGTNAAGTLTRWVRDTFYGEELEMERKGGKNAYAVMAGEAGEIQPAQRA